MQAITAKRVLAVVIVLFCMSLLLGCSGMEPRPENRSGYLYYPAELVNADRALDEARMAGKDKECPAEYDLDKSMVDKAYAVYMACRTEEAINRAKEATGKIKALCPAKPVAVVKPEPKPVPPPLPPPPPPAPVVEPVKIILEDIHFNFDKASLTDAAKAILDKNIKTLRANPGVNLIVEGHTCAHGAEDYNMRLSERRANAVKEYLVKEGAIGESRLSTITYGETRLAMPETPTPKNKESKEAQENRRVHFEVVVK